MPSKKPTRVDDLKGPTHKRGGKTPRAQVPQHPADTASVPAPIRQFQQLTGLQGNNRDLSVNADHAFIRASRLLVAHSQMNLASTRQEGITTVTEILVNLIGTERFACLTFHKDRRQLECLFSMGIDDDRIAALELASEEMEALLGSETRISMNGRAGCNGSEPVAVVPLRLKDEPFGLIVILAFLPQKNGLERRDYALCDLLSKHAAACISRNANATGNVRRNDS